MEENSRTSPLTPSLSSRGQIPLAVAERRLIYVLQKTTPLSLAVKSLHPRSTAPCLPSGCRQGWGRKRPLSHLPSSCVGIPQSWVSQHCLPLGQAQGMCSREGRVQRHSRKSRENLLCSQHRVVTQAGYHIVSSQISPLGGDVLPVYKWETEFGKNRSHLTQGLWG